MDTKAMLWNSPRPPAREPKPGELLFVLGEFWYGHDGFVMHRFAVQWAEEDGPFAAWIERVPLFSAASS